MSTRKPTLPPAGHLAIASAVTSAVADASPSDIETLPAKVRDSLAYFNEVTAVAQAIEAEQPEALAPYREDIALAIECFGESVSAEEADAITERLLSSHLFARLLADVAAGNIEPVATVTRASSTPAKPAPTKAEQAGEETPAKPERAKRTRKKAEPAPPAVDTPTVPAEQPAAPEPAPVPVPDDDPFSEPAPVPVGATAVTRPAGWDAGSSPDDYDDDDF